MAVSRFVAEQMQALREAFGDPEAEPELAVSYVQFQTHTGDVKPNDALRVARTGRREAWNLGDETSPYRIAVAVGHPRGAANTIVVVIQDRDGRTFVSSAWPVPEIDDASPTETLLSVVEAAGLPIEVQGGPHGRFIAHYVSSTGELTIGSSRVPTGASFALEAMMQRREDSARVGFAYAIDPAAHRRWLSGRTGGR